MVCLVDYQKWLKDGGNTLKKTKKTVLTLGSTSVAKGRLTVSGHRLGRFDGHFSLTGGK